MAEAPVPPAAYSVEPADVVRDRATILAVWRSGFNYRGDPDRKLEWYYERNPAGRAQVFLLRGAASAAPIGVAALGARRMHLGAVALTAGFLVDFVVEPAHRGFFPALFLQKEILRRSEERFPLIFGAPNPQSDAIVRRAGYRLLGNAIRVVRVLRSGSYLSRHLPRPLADALGWVVDHARAVADRVRHAGTPRYRCAWQERADDSFDGLWERVAGCGLLIGVRDRAFLEWRFAEYPYLRHRFFTVRSPGDGRLVAYAACFVQDYALVVADFLVDPAAHGAGKRLWHDLASDARRQGLRSLTVDFFGSPATLGELLAAGMRPRSERPVYAAFPGGAELGETARWYFTNADEDA